ncbi:putative C6 transcription factor [Hypomontagnella monticulosa]|nr:putative C6 transcription factor [Hypomontagnella monticulosa]
MDRRGPVHSAPYGQACVNCFKSKCKCVSRPDGSSCERCHRLGKDCRPSDGLRRRNLQKNKNSSTRIAQLEGKLEGLVSILKSVADSSDSSDALRKVFDQGLVGGGQPQQQQAADAEHGLSSSVPSSGSRNHGIRVTNVGEASVSSPPTTPSSPGVNSVPNPSTNPYEPSADEAEKALNVFRSQMVKHLAFLHIPPDVNAQQLRQTKPFLFRAIVAVTSTSTQDKLVLGKELKQILAENAVVENQSSLDLLLGVLVYVAWGWDPFLTKDGTVSRLMMLAISLVGNLRFNKPLPQDVHMIGPITPGFPARCRIGPEDPEQLHLERQRAVLGCFVLSSIISSYYAQMDAMRWTPKMEEGLQAISLNEDCPTDQTFAFQVRLQLLAERSVHAREQQEASNSNPNKASLPAFLYLNALRAQLQELRGSLSPVLERQEFIIAQIHYVELSINEAAHTANSDAPLLTTTGIDGTGHVSDFERIECLWRSVTAIKSWLDIFLSLPPSEFRGFSFLLWAQMARCVVILYRLSTLEDPAWDRKAVRNVIDLPLVLDQIAEKLELTCRESNESPDDNLFMQFHKLLKMFRALVCTKMAPERTGEQETWVYNDTIADMNGNILDSNQNQMMQLLDFGNESWWEELSANFR